jgi:hypothetical protein
MKPLKHPSLLSLLLVVFALFWLSSCFKKKKEPAEKECENSCYTIQGKITNATGNPVSKLRIEIHYKDRNRTILFSNERLLSTIFTAPDGSYGLSFSSDYYKDHQSGYISIRASEHDLTEGAAPQTEHTRELGSFELDSSYINKVYVQDISL